MTLPRAPHTAVPALLAAGLVVGGLAVAAPAAAASPDVVIAEVYGGGGGTGAARTHDFVELHNPTSADVDLDGWSVQYASATGTSWQVTPLAGTVGAGKRYLVQLAGGTTGAALPAPQATGTTSMSGTNGKVALVPSTTACAGADCGTVERDLVGYGTANAFEGTAAAPAASVTTSVARTGADTDQNGTDFAAGTPTPEGDPVVAGEEPPPASDPCETLAEDVTRPYTIQGTPAQQGPATESPLVGRTVTTYGVVVGRVTGSSSGL